MLDTPTPLILWRIEHTPKSNERTMVPIGVESTDIGLVYPLRGMCLYVLCVITVYEN